MAQTYLQIQSEQLTLIIEQGIDKGLAILAEREKRLGKLHSQEMANIIVEHTKEFKATT